MSKKRTEPAEELKLMKALHPHWGSERPSSQNGNRKFGLKTAPNLRRG